MPDSDNTRQRPPRKKKGIAQHYPLIILLVLLLVVAAGVSIYFLTGTPPAEEPLQQPETAQVTTGQLPIEQPVPHGAVPGQYPDTEQTVEGPPAGEQVAEPGVPGPAVSDELQSRQEKECELLGNKLYNFFIHIDSKEYIKSFALQESSQSHFIRLAYKLLDNPPVVTRESDDLYTILKNMAHFFRIIGKDNILLIKTILDRERDKIEDVASELYQWIAYGSCSNERFDFDCPLNKAYEYAGFFLNTMGGRSYLFRRDSRSRLLVNYYSILIVAGAIEQGLNRHGIDISLLIPQLIQEIEATNQLIYKENYLDQLYGLLEEYQ